MLPVPTPPPFTLEITNLRALRHVRWSPGGVCALVGSNGSGKSTLLQALRLLRSAVEHDMPEAIRATLGSSDLLNWGASPTEEVELAVRLGDLRWSVRLAHRGPTETTQFQETLEEREVVVLARDAAGNLTFGGRTDSGGVRLGLRILRDRGVPDDRIARVARLVSSFSVFQERDLLSLRLGSKVSDDRELNSRGTNAIAILRRWFQERPHRPRYEFVLHGLRTACPRLVHDLDFQEAGQTVAMRIYPHGREHPRPLASEANGVLGMMVLLCDVASAEPGGVVAIDEPENALHPGTIRAFLEAAELEARKKSLTIILATHSPMLLDRLAPQQIFVLDANSATTPTRLDELKDPQWLSNFRIGELFMDCELSSLEAD